MTIRTFGFYLILIPKRLIHNSDCPINLIFRNRKRRRDAPNRVRPADLIDIKPQLKAACRECLDQVITRLPRFPICHNFHTQKQAAPAHVTDGIVPFLQFAEAIF